jgi:ribosomal protein L24E
VSKESSLTGEVYVRADGKTVRRIKKSSGASVSGSTSVSGDDNVEIVTRPDGTKVRRIRKPKSADGSVAESTTGSTKTESTPRSSGGLSGFLGQGSSESKPRFSGSHSVAGDQHLEGEIYVRADGKKVRRVRKAKESSDFSSGSSLSGFLSSEVATKPKHSGAATVVGDIGRSSEPDFPEKSETEIYVRPDGTVRFGCGGGVLQHIRCRNLTFPPFIVSRKCAV